MTEKTAVVAPPNVKGLIAVAIQQADDGPDRGAGPVVASIAAELEAVGIEVDEQSLANAIEAVPGWDEIGADELADEICGAVSR